MHFLQGNSMPPDDTPGPMSSSSVGVPQDMIASPNAPQEHMIPFTHMGQPRLEEQLIKEPGLPEMGKSWDDAPPSPVAALGSLLAKTPAQKPDFSDLMQGDTAMVEQIIDPLRLRMHDGRIVQLAGIDLPDLDPYDPGPLSLAARNQLKSMLEGKQVRLFVTRDARSGRINRLGDILAQLELPSSGIWVQGALLSAGLARVRPTQRNPEMAAQMIKLEDQARADKKGLWADPRYGVLTPDNAASGENGIAIVEGRIVSVGNNNNITYLDFGPDWHTDFTVAIDADMRRALMAKFIDPQSLGGRLVRVRGWVRNFNGPYMELDNPAWLEILPGNSSLPLKN